MKLKTLLPLLCAALAAGLAPAALGQNGPAYYLDVNGTAAGFGDPTGLTVDWAANDWTTDPTGTAAPVSLPSWYDGSNFHASQLVFGSPGTTGVSNSTFTVTANGPMIAGVTFNAPCEVNLMSFNVFNFLAPETWLVPAGSTFSIAQANANWAFTTIVMNGGGTVNFNCNDVGRNGGNFVQDMTNGTVNLTDAYVDPGTAQASYELRNGTLNFATGLSASAIGGVSPSHTQNFKLSGGTVDNTSGGAMTLSLGNANCQIGGSFAFAGSSSLAFGNNTIDLGTVTPTITVSNNTLEFDGALTDTAGLTVAGAGTLMLTAVNTYSGNTTISAGTLALSGAGSIATSPQISIASGATFDVSAAGWSGSGSQMLGSASTSGTGTVSAGGQSVILNSGDGLSFQAAGSSTPSVGNIHVAGASASLNLNNNAVTINVAGSQLAASTNTLLTVEGTLNGSANSAPVFTGLGLAIGCGAQVITTSGGSGSLVLVVTNTPHGTQPSSTAVTLTTGTSSEIYGGQLTFTATVHGTTTSPTGFVIFKDGANNLATVALTPGTPPNSTATYTEYTTLNVSGSPHSLTAFYEGDSTYNTSDSSASPLAQTITPKALTYSGLTASTNAAYDGTTVAALGGTPVFPSAEAPGTGSINDGVPYNVDVVATGGTAVGVLAAKNVGSEPVTVSGVTVTGTGAANYTVTQQTGLVETVVPKNIAVAGLAINITNAPALTGTASLLAPETPGSATGGDGAPYLGESVSLTGTPVGTAATNSAAFNLVVNVSGLSLAGADAANYSLMQPFVLHGPTANGPAYYLDVNDVAPGFGDPSGLTINWNDAMWTTDPAGTNPPAALPFLYDENFQYTPVQLTFGNPGVDGISNSTFSVASQQDIAGVVFNAPCTMTLTSFGIFSFQAPQAWSVPTGSTFNIEQNFANWAFPTVLMLGGGTVNFNCNDVGRNAGNFVQDMTGGTVNLTDAYLDTGTAQASYELRDGTLNFATAASVNALGGPGGGRYFRLSGGAVDNTSGSSMTLNLGAATCQINGNFAFAGSSSLNFGAGGVDLGTVTPTITVSNNTLEFDGTLAGSAGLTKAGTGTLMLTAANSYTGDTTVSGGVLDISQASLATTSTITIASGATLQLDFSVTNTVKNLVLNGVSQPAGVYKASNASPYLTGTGSLLVVGTTAPAPANITYTLSGQQVSLNWPSGQGWLLQSNSLGLGNPNGWFTVTGATPPFTNSVNPSTPSVFYRLKY
ncbi:MAG TPA: autotransporter-associated beta strand repeat-containing protein [Verrucomicrobiae bacterium]|jgi:autotransporter-associated beta strand protein|nr:autotransporter-associated beta strand repeat-containing protein [Verrucomicrobiae bacterium]